MFFFVMRLCTDHKALGQLLADIDHVAAPLRPVQVVPGPVGLGGDVQIKDPDNLPVVDNGILP